MSVIESIILGILQGITEFLPVSSSGHLVIAQKMVGLDSKQLLFSVVVHVATLSATLVVLRKQVIQIISAACKRPSTKTRQERDDTQTFYWIVITTIVTGSLGFLLKDFFQAQFDSIEKVATCLMVTGIILFLPTWLNPKQSKYSHQIGPKNAVLLGLAQTLAILPGISRSGTTIVTCLLLGLKRKDSGEMAFLISIPIILAALLLELLDLHGQLTVPLLQLTLGFLAAFTAGWISLHYLLRWVRNGELHYFGLYCWLAAAILFIV
ncbi:MAG: undecaprenyl-diphosphate phosphatase [Bdellovibrionota bacterium]